MAGTDILSLPVALGVDGNEWLPLVQGVGADAVTKRTQAKYIKNPDLPLVRERLLANRTYYVLVNGSNANTGLENNPAGAFATIQHAVNVVLNTLDFSGFNVIIQVGAGNFTAGAALAWGWTGGGTLTIQGVGPTSSITASTGSVFSISGIMPSTLYIRSFKLKSLTEHSGLIVVSSRSYVETSNIESNGSGGGYMGMFTANVSGAQILISGGMSITGGGSCYVMAQNGGTIQFYNQTISLTGTPAFSWVFAQCGNPGSLIACSGIPWNGTATGPRYGVSSGAYISTGGGGANYLPGSISGTGTNFGVSPWGLYQ